MYQVCKSQMINQSTPVRNQNLVITLFQCFEFSFRLINKMQFQYKLYPTKTLITKMLIYIDCYKIYIYIYVYVYVCMCVCMYVYICVCGCPCVYILSFVIDK